MRQPPARELAATVKVPPAREVLTACIHADSAGGLREDPDASTLVVVDTGLPDQCTPRELSELQTGPEAGMVFATYNGRGLCSASDLFAALDPSWGSLHLWNGVEWMPYAEAVPGMSDFMIQSGDLLCLIADQQAQAAMIR